MNNKRSVMFSSDSKVVRVLLFSFLCVFISCRRPVSTSVSFYYWKTVFTLDSNLKHVLKSNDVNKLYIRFFDIHLKNGQALPLSPILFKEHPLQKVVPVIYIKNEVMLDTTVNLKALAYKSYNFIQQITERNLIHFTEIQLDCDWTLKSKSNYFRFVQEFKKVSKKELSATIRLHQIKYYQKTGIPDVEKGVLMYYNMGKIDADTSNSIYEKNIAQLYVNSLTNYPLKLNVALPVFSWSVVSRNGKVVNLIGKTTRKDYHNNLFFKSISPDRFVVKESILHNGVFFKKNDIIKVESVSRSNLDEMVQDLKTHLKQKPSEIIFYDLDTINTRPFTDDKAFFKKISTRF